MPEPIDPAATQTLPTPSFRKTKADPFTSSTRLVFEHQSSAAKLEEVAAKTKATAKRAFMSMYLSKDDVEAISRMVASEVGGNVDGDRREHVKAVTDSILNRVEAGFNAPTIQRGIDRKWAFTGITEAGGWRNWNPQRDGGLSQKRMQEVRSMVKDRLAEVFATGKTAPVFDFANPEFTANYPKASKATKRAVAALAEDPNSISVGSPESGRRHVYGVRPDTPYTVPESVNLSMPRGLLAPGMAADSVDRYKAADAQAAASYFGDVSRPRPLRQPAPTFSLGDRVITDTPNTVGGGILSAAQAVGNFAGNIYSRAQDAAPRPPQGVPQGPLERLRSMSISRNPFDTQQGAAAPVTPVQRSPLAAPQAPKTDALSRLRSIAEPQGDMRANPMDRSPGTYALGADPVSRDMAAQASQPGRRTVVSGQAPQVSTPARPTTPRETVRAFGRATAEPGFMTSDMARRTPVSVAAAPRAVSGITGTAPGLARAASAPSSVASATGGVLGMIGSGIAGGFNRTLSALGTAPAAPVGVQQAAQVQQAKAVSPQRAPAPTISRNPFDTQRAAVTPRAPQTLGNLAAATQSFPKADPNKINTAALQSAAMGAGSGLLSGGIPGAVMGGLAGYVMAPNANNPMNATTFGTDQGGFFGGLGSMFSGGGSGRDSTGASFSRGTYSDGPGRGLSYGASASRSGTRSGPTAGRQAGGSK